MRILAFLAVLGFILWGCKDDSCDHNKLSGTVRITGIPQVGGTLTAKTSKLSGYGKIYYRWKRDIDTTIGEDNTYIVQTEDIGSSISVTVSRYCCYEQYSEPPSTYDDYYSSITSPSVVISDYTQGLAFTLTNNGTAYSVSKGKSTVQYVIIPSTHNGLPVVEIADSGFSSYANMTSIIIPSGVTRIGNYAFFNCDNLTSVTIPIGVSNIGNFAFQGCNNLTTVFYGGENVTAWTAVAIGSNNTPLLDAEMYLFSEIYPSTTNTHWGVVRGLPIIWTPTQGLVFNLINNSTEYSVSKGTATSTIVVIPAAYEGKPVTRIGSSGFSNYSNMTNITIPNSMMSINDYAFYGCGSLASISIPNSVTSIGASAFSGCSSLTSITIPSSVTSIGASAFSGCSSLTSITIPSGVTSIGSAAFFGCRNLTSINVDENNLYYIIQNGILYNKSMSLILAVQKGVSGSITIPNSVTSIGDGAFSNCRSLTSITIPSGVTSISSAAFYDCSNLTSITIPNGVTSIGYSAFSYCGRLARITLPSSVTSISSGAFSETGIWKNTRYGNVVYADKWAVGYNGETYGDYGPSKLNLNQNTIGIGDSAFSNCSNLTSITIPNSVTSIGDSAFHRSNFTSITIPNSVTSIGDYAFGDTYYIKLRSVTFMGTSTNLSYRSFVGDLREKYLTGGIGIYTRPAGSDTWTKQ